MNLSLITTKISIIFIFAISILIALFFFYLDYEGKHKYSNVQSYYENISVYAKDNKMKEHELIKYMETLPFKVEFDVKKVLDNSTMIFNKRGYEILEYQSILYFHIRTPFFRVLFKDLNTYSYASYTYVIFIALLLLLVSLYVLLIKSLQPLKELKNNISSFSQGNLSINCKSDRKDEIADVSNEFDKAVRKIELLLNSRQLFLRTVMHELKTPIAKGRIVSELIAEDKQKIRMIDIFERLDYLINDFSKVEQVISNNYELIRQNHSLEKIFKVTLNSLMLDVESEKVQIDVNMANTLKVDISLMSMVFKNLMDNALRYSSDGKIRIEENKTEFLFISKGNKLDKEIEEYYKPFHNDVKSKNHGMGLGLYIIKSILDMHKFGFEYEHKDESNIFKIKKTSI